jgi:hypothetical protein
MLLAMPVVFPSFEIATPRIITMMLTTSMISNSVKPCCFLFVLISIKGDLPSPVSDYTTAIFKNCYQHLVWINADELTQMKRHRAGVWKEE